MTDHPPDCPCLQPHYDGESIHIFSTNEKVRWHQEEDGTWIQRPVDREWKK